MSSHNVALEKIALLREAALVFTAGNEPDAIFYSTEALCAGTHRRFDTASRKFKQTDEVITALLKDTTHRPYNPTKGSSDLLHKCAQLPESWTVFQLNKRFTPRWSQLTHSQLMAEATPVDITLLCYPNSELLQNAPLSIRLDPPPEADFFSVVSAIPVKLKKYLSDEISSGGGRLDEMETYIGTVIERIRAWLGPWIVLFSGKFTTGKALQAEAEVFNRVEDFCIVNKRSKRDQVLISLVARRLDMIDGESIYRFCCEVADSEEQLKALYGFLVKLKSAKVEAIQQFGCSPCLMIIDELLDGYPWEMMNTDQDFTRLGSFRMLWSLFSTHKDRIRNGFLHVPTENCHNIINPDKTLKKMSHRLQSFYKEWFPNFKLIIDQPPTPAEYGQMLQEADVVIYNGHGSGLQFIDGDTILQQDIRAVVFLFGCDSVRLYPTGLFSEMSGSHLYYHVAEGATVVGALWVLTDFYTDYYSILLVGSWIPSPNPKFADRSVLELDYAAFKTGKLEFCKIEPEDDFSGNLLALMSQFRRCKWMLRRIRCAMVCRGLPVMGDVKPRV